MRRGNPPERLDVTGPSAPDRCAGLCPTRVRPRMAMTVVDRLEWVHFSHQHGDRASAGFESCADPGRAFLPATGHGTSDVARYRTIFGSPRAGVLICERPTCVPMATPSGRCHVAPPSHGRAPVSRSPMPPRAGMVAGTCPESPQCELPSSAPGPTIATSLRRQPMAESSQFPNVAAGTASQALSSSPCS